MITFEHFLSLSVDNYLAMDVACTLICPIANYEVIIAHPGGNETQKCEKCEGDCPKGEIIVSLWVICFKHCTLFTYTQLPRRNICTPASNYTMMWQQLDA